VVDRDFQFPENIFLVQTRPVTNIPEWHSPTNRVIDSILDYARRTSKL
jgi:hypothetical protein